LQQTSDVLKHLGQDGEGIYVHQFRKHTDDGKEYDVAKKDWGFYATPSMNGRLKKFGFKTAIVKKFTWYVLYNLVEKIG
jgi:hypothetical protein